MARHGIVRFLQLLTVASILAPAVYSKSTIVHLFEWRWPDVALECEQHLGPKGYAAVQVSPPQEHIVLQGQWYEKYQPVSYEIQGRGGSRVEFKDMVNRCKAVGVDILVDAVFNHMTNVGSGVGSAGSRYSEFTYPVARYSRNDFHFCGRTATNKIEDFTDADQVRNCELLNLADLKTEASYVRGRIAEYLNDLLSMGVKGFRVDAAKHMPPADLKAILSSVEGSPLVFQEVIDESSAEPIRSRDYFSVAPGAMVTEFKYGNDLAANMKPKGKLKFLKTLGEPFGFFQSTKAVCFVDNHDTQRGKPDQVLTHKDGRLYELANVFGLAWPYGAMFKVMSSYGFSSTEAGPPTASPFGSNGQITFGFNEPWKGEHRWQPIANMVAWRNAVEGGTSKTVDNWWANDSGNAIAFSRGGLGFVVINREQFDLPNTTFQTGLPSGQYCNVIANEPGAGCKDLITVNSDGTAKIAVPFLRAVALYVS